MTKSKGKVIMITLPGIKAVSRNRTTGHWYNYSEQLQLAENWMAIYGKRLEYHFDKPVNVWIDAYYDSRGRSKACDAPNIDDKIFTDALVRWKQRGKGKAIERSVWFIEDDNPSHLNLVVKRSIPSDHYKVIIKIGEAYEEVL